MTTSSASRFGFVAANALGIAVVADTVSIFVDKGAAVFAVIAAVSAGVAKSVTVIIGKGTIFSAVISAVFTVIAYSVSVLVSKGTAISAIVNGNRASALTSPAAASAVG